MAVYLSLNDDLKAKMDAPGSLVTDWRLVFGRPQENNKVSIVATGPGANGDQTVSAFWDWISTRGVEVPPGSPFLFMDVADIPTDRTFRDAWRFSPTEGIELPLPNGTTLYGSNINDAVKIMNTTGSVWGYGGNDKLIAIGEYANYLDGGTGNDWIEAGGGSDILVGGGGADHLDGGTGDDLIDYSAVDSNLTINLVKGVATGEGTDTLISIEDVTGGSGNDTITGNSVSNELTGGLGNDKLYGGGGNDILYSGTGDDYVDAGDGNDLIIGGDGAGNDRYIGGSGIDTIKYTSAKSGITINLAATKDQAKSTLAGDKAGIGVDQLSGIENIIAGNYDDLLTGNAAANTITAGSGNDTIDGGSGTAVDKIDGGTGTDTISFASLTASSSTATGVTLNLGTVLTTGSAKGYSVASGLGGADWVKGIENITGSKYADVLTGSDGNNVIKGGAGADTLTGGKGLDKLYGGSGDGVKDIFDFNAASESTTTSMDLIYDFVSGKDKIDLSGMTPSKSNNGAFLNDKTKALGTAYKANSVWITKYDASGTANDYVILSADLDGKAGADFAVKLVGINNIVTADIVL